MSLGGVRDEARSRHRRTYIGSLPAKVIQSMKKRVRRTRSSCSTRSTAGRGLPRRPVVALLEVLDPSRTALQRPLPRGNYDLSNVMFITTANSCAWRQPLMDRMETSGWRYTEDEKVTIARKHTDHQQIEANGLREASSTP